MDSKSVNKAIREIIKPILEENGFTQFTARSAWRYRNNRIDVINFQSFNSYLADSIGCTTYSFSVNLGCFLLYIPDKKWIKAKDDILNPPEYSCHLRGRLFRTYEQKELDRKDIWYIDPKGSYLSKSLEDVRRQIEEKAFPWYACLASDVEILHILKENDENKILWGFGNNPSPKRSFITAYVALHLDQKALAKQKINEVIRSGCYSNLLDELKKTENGL